MVAQFHEHPSPSALFPSSHVSLVASVPSPHPVGITCPSSDASVDPSPGPGSGLLQDEHEVVLIARSEARRRRAAPRVRTAVIRFDSAQGVGNEAHPTPTRQSARQIYTPAWDFGFPPRTID